MTGNTLSFRVLAAVCAIASAAPTIGAGGQQLSDTLTLVLPPHDSSLQAALDAVMRESPFRNLVRRGQLSVALVDLTDPDIMRYAAVDDDRMRYAASLPKIAIMLTVFDQVHAGRLDYTPQLRAQLEKMIRHSDNRTSTQLIELVGFNAISRTLRDPRYELYDEDRNGGLWVGRDYGGGIGLWRRDPMHNISHGATARQVARFLVMLEEGQLVSPWASDEMKAIMSDPAIEHKFVLGLRERPGSSIFRKSGTWRTWHADAALVERDGRRYAAVALMESSTRGVLARLIVRLDDVIFKPSVVLGGPPSETERDPGTTY